jgi:NADH dehydrogenase
MKNQIFITGFSGFIGRHILRKLDFDAYDHIFCLSRNQGTSLFLPVCNNLTFILGDVSNPTAYKSYLSSTTTVLHLAALTGKAPPDQYMDVNVRGTQILVDACRRANIQHFIYISSIAVKYPDLSRYPYAQSKQHAEDIVRDSGLNYTIIRPTIVLGKEAPIWKRLLQLARLPVMPLFGDGQNKLQPIYVEDLALCVLALIEKQALYGQTLDLGGPDVLSMEELLCRIRQHVSAKAPRRMHLPPKYLLPILVLIERVLPSLLPFHVGQLSAFLYDSTIDPNCFFYQFSPQMKNINTMLRHLIYNNKEIVRHE